MININRNNNSEKKRSKNTDIYISFFFIFQLTKIDFSNRKSANWEYLKAYSLQILFSIIALL